MASATRPESPVFPPSGWLGLLILISGEAALLAGSAFAATWFTPIMWTGYILLADAVVFRRTGSSWLQSQRREFVFMALVSVLVWLLFEAYNFHLRNWQYAGLPPQPWLRNLGYFWSFATIMPGVFETWDLLGALLDRRRPRLAANPAGSGPDWPWFLLGLAMVTIPLATPAPVAAFLFGSVWVGFILLLDPINRRMGAPSLLANWRAGNRHPILLLLLAGLACGVLWESWNFQTYLADGAHWIYTVPQPLRILGLHFGKMPILGMLGFPPFALELLAFYTLLRAVFGAHRWSHKAG